MKRITSAIFSILIVLISYSSGLGMDFVLFDDFDDGSLHPDWNISYHDGAIGWTYTEEDTNLIVTDIQTDSVIQEPSGVPWPTVSLSRSFPPLDDFQIDFQISWDSYDDAGTQRIQAMQFLIIYLYDDADNFIGIGSGYLDGWVGGNAIKYAMINNIDYNLDSLPLSGSAHIEIRRNNGIVDVLWDSIAIANDTNNDTLGRVDLVFGYDPYDGNKNGIPEAYFGKESIDLISILGNPLSPPEDYIVEGNCSGIQWEVNVIVNNRSLGNYICEKGNKITETIGIPVGPGKIVLTANGPNRQECSTFFSYEKYLDKLKLECKDGSKDDKVEAKFEIKRHGHGPGHDD